VTFAAGYAPSAFAEMSRICARIIAELFAPQAPLFRAGVSVPGMVGSHGNRAPNVYDIHRVTAAADVHTVHPNPSSVRDAAIAAIASRNPSSWR